MKPGDLEVQNVSSVISLVILHDTVGNLVLGRQTYVTCVVTLVIPLVNVVSTLGKAVINAATRDMRKRIASSKGKL